MEEKEFHKRINDVIDKVSLYEVVSDHAKTWYENEACHARVLCVLDESADTSHSFIIVKEKNIFFCGICKKGGNAVSYISFLNKCPIEDAVTYLEEKYGKPKASVVV